MKKNKILSFAMAVLLIVVFCVFALGSGESSTNEQGTGVAESATEATTKLGDYNVEIKTCRLAKDYEGKSVAIITYGFTNNADNSTAFAYTFDDQVYQDGVGLNKAYVLADSANYAEENQTKEIKKGATLDVEIAYELNDTTTDLEVEVKELFSFDDHMVKKTFTIAQQYNDVYETNILF